MMCRVIVIDIEKKTHLLLSFKFVTIIFQHSDTKQKHI